MNATVWGGPERRRWPRIDLRPFGLPRLRLELIEPAPRETPIGAKVRDISPGGLGIETVRPIVLSDPFTAELLANPSSDPVSIEAKPVWQQPINGGQRWGVAVLTSGPLVAFITTSLRDEAVQSQINTVSFVLEAPQAHSVSVAGDFNDWDTQSHPLQKDLSGVWRITVPLPPGRYEYQFYLDGYWHNDPLSTQRVRNLFGTENDVIEVPTGS